MAIGTRWWVLWTLLASASDAMATLAITGEVLIDPPAATLLRGQTATLTYTLTNTGDEPFDAAFSGTVYIQEGPTSTVFPFPTAATPPCTFQLQDLSPAPGQPTTVGNTNSFHPRPIPPGESRQCVMGLQVSPQTAGPFVQRFGISGTRGSRTVSVARNIAFNLGQPQPSSVPAISNWGLALLGLLVLAFGRR